MKYYILKSKTSKYYVLNAVSVQVHVGTTLRKLQIALKSKYDVKITMHLTLPLQSLGNERYCSKRQCQEDLDLNKISLV